MSRISTYWKQNGKNIRKTQLAKEKGNCKTAYVINTTYGQGMSEISDLFWDQSQPDPEKYLRERMGDLPFTPMDVFPEREVQDC